MTKQKMANCWLCPLYNFKNKAKTTSINNFQIIKAWKQLIEELGLFYQEWDLAGQFDFMVAIPMTEKYIKPRKPIDRVNEPVNKHRELNDFITALRLCHKGEIIPGPLISAISSSESGKQTYTFELHGWAYTPTTFGYLWGFFDVSSYKPIDIDKIPSYTLVESDIPIIKNLSSDYSSIILQNLLGVPTDRFNSSYYGKYENRLIDQMIAFESLYLGDDKELRYKLAMRTAFLLAKRESQRTKIFKDMKKAYDLRSEIVHGNIPSNKDELRDTTQTMEEYLRQSLKKFLILISQGKSLKETLQNLLDKNIITTGKTLNFT
jgi:hypothetical protein